MQLEQPEVYFHNEPGYYEHIDFTWYGDGERLHLGIDPKDGPYWFWVCKVEKMPRDFSVTSSKYFGKFSEPDCYRNFLEMLKRFEVKPGPNLP